MSIDLEKRRGKSKHQAFVTIYLGVGSSSQILFWKAWIHVNGYNFFAKNFLKLVSTIFSALEPRVIWAMLTRWCSAISL